MHFALMLAGNRAGERGAVVEAAAAGRGQQVPRSGPRRRRAGRGRPGQAAAGRPQLRRRPGDGLRRRFHLALVDARIRIGLQAVLAADRALAGARRPGAGGQRLGPAAAAALCAVAAGGVHRRRHRAHRRAGRRRRLQGRDRLARRRPPAACRWCARRSRWPARSATRKPPATTPSKSRPRRRTSRWASARARFLVFRQDLELDNASADAATLESLAAMTGGQSLAPEQLPDLVRD